MPVYGMLLYALTIFQGSQGFNHYMADEYGHMIGCIVSLLFLWLYAITVCQQHSFEKYMEEQGHEPCGCGVARDENDKNPET